MKERHMLIIELLLTETGMKVVDVDGGAICFSAEDVLEIAAWIEKHTAELEVIQKASVATDVQEDDAASQQRLIRLARYQCSGMER